MGKRDAPLPVNTTLCRVSRRWVQEIDDHDGPEPRRRLLLGHKSDLASERVVAPEDGDRLAAELGVPFAEASSRSGEGVEASVQRLALGASGRAGLRLHRPPPGPKIVWGLW